MVKNPDCWFEGAEVGERILFMTRAHQIVNVGWILVAIFLIILPLVLFAGLSLQPFKLPISTATLILAYLIWVLIILGGAFQWLLHWVFNVYILTDRRIVDIDFAGLFNRQVSQASLRNIEDVTFKKQGLLQSFFDYGNLYIQTAGTAQNFEFTAIPDPEDSLKQILDLISRVKKGLPIDVDNRTAENN